MIHNILENVLGLWSMVVFIPIIALMMVIFDIIKAILGVIGVVLMYFALIAYVLSHPYDSIFKKDYEFKWEILRKILGKE